MSAVRPRLAPPRDFAVACQRSPTGGTVRRLLLVPLALAAVGLWALLDEENGIRRWLALRQELARSEDRIAARRGEIAELRAEADALRNDPLAIEAAIREELGLAKPDEIVIRFPPLAPGIRESPRLP